MIAFIPARGGSKGLPRKNIKILGNRPLIAYTITAALNSRYIDRVVVTTDDEEIAKIAKEYGAEIPFIRPSKLAQDHSRAQDVYLHAAEFMRDNYGSNIEKFIILLPTVPFRTERHIDSAIETFNKLKAETLVSIKRIETPVTWLLKADERGKIINAGFDAENASGNRQENKIYYVPNGAIYILDYELLKTQGTYYSDNTVGFLMSEKDSIDIDTMDDFEYAEFELQRRILGIINDF